jgi:hypothetical protein
MFENGIRYFYSRFLTERFWTNIYRNEIIAHTETIQFQIIAMKESAKLYLVAGV